MRLITKMVEHNPDERASVDEVIVTLRLLLSEDDLAEPDEEDGERVPEVEVEEEGEGEGEGEEDSVVEIHYCPLEQADILLNRLNEAGKRTKKIRPTFGQRVRRVKLFEIERGEGAPTQGVIFKKLCETLKEVQLTVRAICELATMLSLNDVDAPAIEAQRLKACRAVEYAKDQLKPIAIQELRRQGVEVEPERDEDLEHYLPFKHLVIMALKFSVASIDARVQRNISAQQEGGSMWSCLARIGSTVVPVVE